jgi:hypothetical protein
VVHDCGHQDRKGVPMCEQNWLDLGPRHYRKSRLVHGARLCHESGGELEQIQFFLGHVSVQTTERYLGCKQRLREAVNDKIGLETISVCPAAV